MQQHDARGPASSKRPRVRVGVALRAARNKTSACFAAAALRVRLEAFCSALERATGLRVSACAHEDYDALLRSVLEHEVDIAWLPPLMAVHAIEKQTATALLVPVRGGSSSYWSALFCRHDSPIRTLADLKGRRIAWVDPQSAAGHTVMRAWLRAHGVDVERTFSRAGFVGSHDAVVGNVLGGKADVGATFAHVAGPGQEPTGPWHDAPVRVIGLAGPIPSDVLAAGTTLTEATIRTLRDALTGEVDSELRGAALALFEADRFVPASAVDLEPLRALDASAKLRG
ncbi:MAG: phosphate/phosphite/phosphonate ABC transporter substrate-binding protein [Deltaproteobacteria bacterium]|nr:phosphate/phosphite/phosphonate ABC transporter substrate-binding protein [Deltaproteobacteria bacterium]